MGFTGSLSTVKRYIATHQNLIPAKRRLVAPQGNRCRRYKTHPGETYQMDWGFANAIDPNGNEYRIACFAIVCNQCGQIYVEFFPNAKQECLFIGMLHAFYLMGVPRFVLTDNMKSVVNKRDLEGHPIWNSEYEAFMNDVGFNTKLCKPRHPFTKGKVERLIRYVKDNFLVGRVFQNIKRKTCRSSEDFIGSECHTGSQKHSVYRTTRNRQNTSCSSVWIRVLPKWFQNIFY